MMHRYRFGLALLLCMLFGGSLAAQPLQVQLQMNPRPSPYLSDWQDEAETVLLTVNNVGTDEYEVKLATQILEGSRLVANTDVAQMPSLVIGPGAQTFLAADIIPYSAVKIQADLEETALRTGKIPAGNYQICVLLIDAFSGDVLSQEQCRPFFVTSYEAPRLIAPADGAVLAAEEIPLFRWSPVLPAPELPPVYQLAIFEILPGQTAGEAFNTNPPVYAQDLPGQTQLVLPFGSEVPAEPGQQFVWSVLATDETGRPLADGEGWAAPFGFSLPPERETLVPCSCKECFLNGIRFEKDGQIITGGRLIGGDGITVQPNFITDCPPECELTIKGQWIITIVNSDGESSTIESEGPQAEFTAPDGGQVLVQFQGEAFCDGRPCPCERGEWESEITVAKRPPIIVEGPRRDSITRIDTTYRPPHEGLPPDSIRIPPYEGDPPTTIKDRCTALPVAKDPGGNIDLGILLDEPDLFKYPRAVPLRADAVDWDYVIFRCDGCPKGTAELWKPVRDNVRSFTWKLQGKGSLNTPFTLDAIAGTNDSLEGRIKELAAIEAELAELREERDSLPARLQREKDVARTKLDAVEQQLRGLRDTLQINLDSLSAIGDTLSRRIQSRSELMTRRDAKNDSLQAAGRVIDSLNILLSGRPGQEETSKLAEVQTARDEFVLADTAVRRKDREILSESQRLADDVQSAQDDLRRKTKTYEDLTEQASILSREITDIQTRMFANRHARGYFQRQGEWRRKTSQLIAAYFSADSLRIPLAAEQTTIGDLGDEAVAVVNARERRARLLSFTASLQQFMARLGQGCNNLSDSAQRAPCRVAAVDLALAAAAYQRTLDTLTRRSYLFNRAMKARLADVRSRLAQMESALAAAAAQVRQAGSAYEQALAMLASTVNRLNEERDRLQETLLQKQERLAELENAYRQLVEERESNLASNRERYLDERHALTELSALLHAGIGDIKDSIRLVDADTTAYGDLKAAVQRDTAALNKRISRHEDLKAKLEVKINQNVQDLLKPLEDAIADLERRRDALQQEIDSLRRQQQQALTGTKEAKGVIAYYIPPPLEEILKDKAEFERLKQEVADKQDSLIFARERKAQVQKLLVKELEKIGRHLVGFKKAADIIDERQDAKDSLDKALSSLKTQKTLDYQQEQLALQNTLRQHEDERDAAEQREQSAERDSSRVEAELIAVKAALTQKESELQDQEQDVQDKQAQRDFAERQVAAARRGLGERSGTLSQARAELEELEDELDRAQNDLARATARNEQAEVAAAQARISAARSAITAKQTLVDQTDGQLKSVAQSHAANEQAFQSSDSLLTAALQVLAGLRREALKLRDSLSAKNDELQEVLTGLNHWRERRRDAEGKVSSSNEARRAMQDSIASQVNADSEVQDKTDAIGTIDDDIQKAQSAQAAAEAGVADALRRKDEALNRANADLERAKNELEKAKEELRAFLRKEFKTVTHSVKLTLEAEDEPADNWRYDDPKKTLTSTLSYKGTRLPALAGRKPGYNLPERVIDGPCKVAVTTDIPAAPSLPPPSRLAAEPRTIALVYKRGKPLWKEWPVIPASVTETLAKDVVPVATLGKDQDVIIHSCAPPPNCKAPPPVKFSIRDLGSYQWLGDGRFIRPQALYETVLWEPENVPQPYCIKPQELRNKYLAAELAGDKEIEARAKLPVHAGVMIEIPDSLLGAPDSVDTARARIVRGDHSGIAGETVEFAVTLVEGFAEDYGFNGGGDTLISKTTNGDGYAEAPFNFGKGFARFRFTASWKRGSNICKVEQFEGLSPLYLQFLRFSTGPPTFAWEAAKKLWQGGGSVSDAVASFPSSIEEGSDSAYAGAIHGVAGYYDERRDFVNDVEISFSTSGDGLRLDPERDTTELFGMARCEVLGAEEDEDIQLVAQCEKRYEPVCFPPEDSASYNTSKLDRFRIGAKEQLFTIVLDEPISRGEVVNGGGKLANKDGQLVGLLSDLSFNISDVELEEAGDDDYVATAGAVSWQAPSGLTTSIFGFEVTLDSVVIRAAMGAGIGGKLGHASLPNPVSFYAEMDTTGDFLGTVADLPELSMAGFTLREGSSFSVDMHLMRSLPGFREDFQGVVIHSAALELPPVFNTAASGQPSTLSVSDFAIGSSGLSGTIALSGTLLELGYAGYHFEVDSLSLSFADDELSGGAFGGAIGLPAPFEGTLRILVSKAGNEWAARVSTDDPISIPRLKTAFMLRSGTGISWDEQSEVGTLTINAVIASENYGEMSIDGFRINSLGEVEAENIDINKSISFGSGFDLHVESLSFALTEEEYALRMKGGFAMPLIGIDEVSGTAAVEPGPTLSVTLEKAEFSFESGPVEFQGGFEFTGEMFRGEFDIGIKNLANKPGGISGLFIVGSQPIDSLRNFTYWYVEMTLGVSIPLGQTGLSLLELGGGVGYNFDPPIGTQPGSPRNTDAFSFKAVIGVGNTPGGEVFAGRLTMALVPGMFSINGKLWLLQQEENMFGEGQLNIRWDPVAQVDGFVQMFVGIPDAEGKIVRFRSKVNFLYSAADFYIKSEEIAGAVLDALKAEGDIDISSRHVKLRGKLYYDFNSTFGFGVVDIIVSLGASVEGSFEYLTASSSLNASASFNGYWDVDIDTPLGSANLIDGSIYLAANLSASPSYLKLSGSARVSWSVWIYSDSAELDVGFETSL